MKADFALRALTLLGGVGVAAVLAGCSTTYGTGTGEGVQTITDFVKAASLRPDDSQQIDFTPRPPVVAPPDTSTLPVPGSGSTSTAVAANWPSDPDAKAAQVKAQIADAQATGRPITVKPSGTSPDTTGSIPQSDQTFDTNSRANYEVTPQQEAEVKRLLALQNSGGVDANGAPVRQYLTDPPSGYLTPDPSAPPPTDTPDQKRKPLLKWPRLFGGG